jgi:uncharacterized protein with PIN domain
MTSKDHTVEVAAKAAEEQNNSPYRCSNCGATLRSKSEKEAHEKSHTQPKSGQ